MLKKIKKKIKDWLLAWLVSHLLVSFVDQLLLGRPCHEQPNGEPSVVGTEAAYQQHQQPREEFEVDPPTPLSQVFKYCSPSSCPDCGLVEPKQEPPGKAAPNS